MLLLLLQGAKIWKRMAKTGLFPQSQEVMFCLNRGFPDVGLAVPKPEVALKSPSNPSQSIHLLFTIIDIHSTLLVSVCLSCCHPPIRREVCHIQREEDYLPGPSWF